MSFHSRTTSNAFAVKIQFDIDIRQLFMDLEDGTEVSVVWIRGGKKIDTKVKQITDKTAIFKERFSMKTNLEFDPETRITKPKPTSFQVFRGKQEQFLGECSIDLATQQRGKAIKEKIQLQKCESATPSFLEIQFKLKDLEGAGGDNFSEVGKKRETEMAKRTDEDPEEIKQLKRATEHILKQIKETKVKIEEKKNAI